MRRLRNVLGILLVLGTAPVACAQTDPIDRLVTLPAAPWGLTAGDVDGDGGREAVFGAIDNVLYVYDDGAARPVADVGGYAMDVVCLDVDGDGADEIVCAVADWPSHASCFKADGTLLWRHETTLCYTALAKGRDSNGAFLVAVDIAGAVHVFAPDGTVRHDWKSYTDDGATKRLQQLSAVDCGDLDGDGNDEIVVGGYRGGLWALNLDGELVWFSATFVPSGSHEAWSTQVPKPVTTGGREYYIDLQRGGLFLRNLRVDDLDGDGNPEVLAGTFRSELKVVSHEGKPLWSKVLNYDVVDHMIKYVHMDQRGCFKDSLSKSQPFFTFVDNPSGKGKWIVAVQCREDILESSTYFGAADLFVLDADGNELLRDVRDASWFRIAPVDGQQVYVSTGMEESELVKVDVPRLVEGEKSTYGHEGLSVPVQNWVDLDETLKSTPARPRTPGTSDKKIKIIVLYDHAMYDQYFFTFDALKKNILALHRHFNTNPDSRIEYVFRVNLQEIAADRPDTKYGLHSPEEIAEFADHCETHGIPIIPWLSHQADLCLRPETIIDMSRRAPNSFRGVMMVESGSLHHPLYFKFWEAVNEFLPTLAENGDKLYLHSTGSFWSRGPSVDPDRLGKAVRDYGKAIVPVIKLNNSAAAEYELGAVLALWKAGFIDEWGYTGIDHWTFTNLCRMNAYKRTSHMGTPSIVGLGLGATYSLYYPPIIRTDRDEDGVITQVRELYPPLANMHVIRQLVEKNIVEPIAPEQAATLSPVLLRTKRLEGRHAAHFNGIMEKGPHFQRVHPNNLSSFAYGLGIGSSGVVPKTPYGMVGILPDYFGLGDLEGRCRTFTTDQHVIDRNGEPLSVEASASALKSALEEAQDDVPFRCADAFFGVHKLGDNQWRLVLVDPGHLRQQGVKTWVELWPFLRVLSVVDGITGKNVGHTQAAIPITIEPGLFRILDVTTE